MAKDGKKTGIIVGVGAGIAGFLYLATRAKAAAPPPTPPLGLANLYGKVTNIVTEKKIPDVLVTLNGMQTFTDAGGNYAFADLEPGGYRLEFSKDGYETLVM